jgi:hypothetical protein
MTPPFQQCTLEKTVFFEPDTGRKIDMKSRLIYSLILVCSAQPALAQQFESDEQWQQQAAAQMKPRTQQSAPKKTAGAKQAVKRQTNVGYASPVRKTGYSAGYGYRPQRHSIGSSYGYRPQRADLMPEEQKIHLEQMRQRLQQRMGAMGGMGGMGQAGQMPMGGMGGGLQQGGQQPNIMQMLMGGGGAQQQQQQMPQAPGGMNRAELMKTFFGGGSGQPGE